MNLLSVLLLLTLISAGAVSFASIFEGESVVLQQDAAVHIWGQSVANDFITISLNGLRVSGTLSDATGAWEAVLPPQPTQWQVTIVATSSSTGDIATTNAKYGHVLLCSGQSNVQMPTSNYSEGGFCAANGTAEVAAAGEFTGKISLLGLETPYPVPTAPPWNGSYCPYNQPLNCTPQPSWNAVSPGVNGTVRGFSAVCWYTGKALFQQLGEVVPIGIIVGSVGGSPIEAWLPEGVLGSICPSDSPPCDTQGNLTDSKFYEAWIAPLSPYTIGAVLWDQGERDVNCYAPARDKIAEYPCNERALVQTWRAAFKSDFGFVAVQLPGYIGDCDSVSPLQPNSTYAQCVPGVFNMRLAQEAGLVGVPNAVAIATYDLSCPFGVNTPECPFGSVHNVIKNEVGYRAAQQLIPMLYPSGHPPVQAPVAVSATGQSVGGGSYIVTVLFAGGTYPLYLAPTQFCALCCTGSVGDFDASADGGLTFTNGTLQSLGKGEGEITFVVSLPSGPPNVIRYTANQGFPQCGIYNQERLPANPFYMAVQAASTASGGAPGRLNRV